jgi:hypothetical protein
LIGRESANENMGRVRGKLRLGYLHDIEREMVLIGRIGGGPNFSS